MFILKLNLGQFEAFIHVELARSRPSDCGDGAKRCEHEKQRGGWGRGVSGRFYTSLLSRVVNSSAYLT